MLAAGTVAPFISVECFLGALFIRIDFHVSTVVLRVLCFVVFGFLEVGHLENWELLGTMLYANGIVMVGLIVGHLKDSLFYLAYLLYDLV
jgi:hypothetical protein